MSPSPAATPSAFYIWLQKKKRRDDPIGDLARDVAEDSSFPSSETNIERLRLHLMHKRACAEALCALDEGYREFSQPQSTRDSITRKIRFTIFKRDGYRCQICGNSAASGARLEVDHKHPVAKGGKNDHDNLWTLCFDCNRGKGIAEL